MFFFSIEHHNSAASPVVWTLRNNISTFLVLYRFLSNIIRYSLHGHTYNTDYKYVIDNHNLEIKKKTTAYSYFQTK